MMLQADDTTYPADYLTNTVKYLCSGDMCLSLVRVFWSDNIGAQSNPAPAQLAKLKPSASAKAACAKLVK